MNKNKISLIVILIMTTLMAFSCKKEKEKENDKINNRNEIAYIEYKIEFPDTVYLNKSYNGEINYKSGLDEIITTFGDKKKNRYTRFIIAKPTNNINYDIEELRKTLTDTFGAIDNRTIPFYDIQFSKLGENYLDGIINDIVLIDTIKSPKENESYPLLRNENRVTHKVIVIEEGKK